ncbi:DUF6180 family protein [Paracoccus aminovorans]|uniref:DUF6180 family protein n=1 Tax=Paracoccus aminovorans TaxID=34004 RepID=UPI002B258569|nr:DUF6180 family protein [Paracoccus aminovorans]
MTRSAWLLGALGLLGSGFPAAAQDADFNVTYHVERTPAAQLSIETCGKAVVEVATQAGLRSATQSYPDQLVTISGGADGKAFVARESCTDLATACTRDYTVENPASAAL